MLNDKRIYNYTIDFITINLKKYEKFRLYFDHFYLGGGERQKTSMKFQKIFFFIFHFWISGFIFISGVNV